MGIFFVLTFDKPGGACAVASTINNWNNDMVAIIFRISSSFLIRMHKSKNYCTPARNCFACREKEAQRGLHQHQPVTASYKQKTSYKRRFYCFFTLKELFISRKTSCKILSVQTCNIGDGYFLGTNCFTSTSIGTGAKSFFIHLCNHVRNP